MHKQAHIYTHSTCPGRWPLLSININIYATHTILLCLTRAVAHIEWNWKHFDMTVLLHPCGCTHWMELKNFDMSVLLQPVLPRTQCPTHPARFPISFAGFIFALGCMRFALSGRVPPLDPAVYPVASWVTRYCTFVHSMPYSGPFI